MSIMLSYSVNVLLMFIILIPLELLAISAYSLYTLSGLKVCGNTEETELKIKQIKNNSINGVIYSSTTIVGIIYLGILLKPYYKRALDSIK